MEYFVRGKVYAQRSLIYYQLIQYVLIIILFLRPYGLNFWVELLLILFIAFTAVFVGRLDRKLKVLEKEQGFFNSENPEIKDILERLKRIEVKLERRNNCDCDTHTIPCDCLDNTDKRR